MRIFNSIFLFLFITTIINAQFDSTWGYINEKQADSLKIAVESEINDTMNMAAFRKLGFYYQDYDDEKSLYFHQRQLELSKKLKLQIWEADAYSQIANQLSIFGNWKKAYEFFIKAEDIASDEKSERPNWEVQNFSNARNEYEARIATLGMNHIMFGNFYNNMNYNDKSMQAYSKALDLGQAVNNGKVIFFYYINAIKYLPDSIPNYMQKALKWADISGYKKQNGWVFYHMCRYNTNMNQFDSAKANAFKSIESSKEQNLDPARISSLFYLSGLYYNENKLDSALFYAKEALLISRRNRAGYLAYAYGNAAHKFASVNKLDSAYLFETKSRKLIDSLKTAKLDRMTDYQQVMFERELQSREDENKLKLFVLIAGLGIVLIVASILYRNNRQKQTVNKALESTLSNLKSTQAQLIQSEKMASLGELTAGIAHEIQNPLNFVNNFSEVSSEMIEEATDELDKGDIDETKEILQDLKSNLEKISHHGQRASGIVRSMLDHSRTSSGEKIDTDINVLCDEYLRLAYHGMRAKNNDFNAAFETNFDESLSKVKVIPQDIGRVLLNLINNAFQACADRTSADQTSADRTSADRSVSSVSSVSAVPEMTSLKAMSSLNPKVKISTKNLGDQIQITVSDNGPGIPDNIKDKIFQPFFTTKPSGQGTGLGLSLSYDIVKAHGGKLEVESDEGKGTAFIIKLPLNSKS
jgi:signal transduction histidine kinase